MKVALLWLINENGEILLAQRALDMDSNPGVWGPSVSGLIEENESPLDAVFRETREELSFLLKEAYFLHTATHKNERGDLLEFNIFYSTIPGTLVDSFTFAKDEVAAVKWIPLSSLKKLAQQKSASLIISSDSKVWKNILENLEKVLNTRLG